MSQIDFSDVKFYGAGVCRCCDGTGKVLFMIGIVDTNSTANETRKFYKTCRHCKGSGEEPFIPIYGTQVYEREAK